MRRARRAARPRCATSPGYSPRIRRGTSRRRARRCRRPPRRERARTRCRRSRARVARRPRSTPGWGPDAVATAPVTTRVRHTGKPTHVTSWRSQRGPAGRAIPARRLQASSTAISASPNAARPRRKCVMTASGWRSRAIVMPPIGICATATRNAPSAAHRPQRERPLDPARRQPRGERENDPDERDHSIAELDECVEALLRIGLVAAARPVLAPESRAREAHEGARRDDEEQRDARRESDAEVRPRRHRSSTSDGDCH